MPSVHPLSFPGPLPPHYVSEKTQQTLISYCLSLFKVVGMGAANGCTDVGGIVDTDTLDGITGNVTDGSYYVTPSASISGKLSPGDRIRIAGSHEVCESLARKLLRSSPL